MGILAQGPFQNYPCLHVCTRCSTLAPNATCKVWLKSVPLVPRKVQVGKDQEKAQSEKDSHSKNRGGKKTN